jgi:hypothetical protein
MQKHRGGSHGRNRSPLVRFVRWVKGLVQIAAVLRDVP